MRAVRAPRHAEHNARAEGYFRREWKQAVERTHDMADDVPFLFPIIIGDVTDTTARVPDKFREVQWTRLRLDETPAEVAAHITRLLAGGAPLPAAREENEDDTNARGKRRKKDGGPSGCATPGRWSGWPSPCIFSPAKSCEDPARRCPTTTELCPLSPSQPFRRPKVPRRVNWPNEPRRCSTVPATRAARIWARPPRFANGPRPSIRPMRKSGRSPRGSTR